MPQLPYFSNCRKFGSQAILYNILESPDYCNLVDYENVKPISPFTFGDVPISDSCENVDFDCVLDEYLEYTYSEIPWFQQAGGTVLFTITKKGISLTQDGLNSNAYSSESVVNIATTNSIESGYLPKKVALVLNYYQVNNQPTKLTIPTITPPSRSAIFMTKISAHSHTKGIEGIEANHIWVDLVLNRCTTN